MLKHVEEKWLQIGILKYKFLENKDIKQIFQFFFQTL